MEKKDYFIGLDMGTSSVGWAVTDTQYNLMRAKGKDMWGGRLFSEALTAADRRQHRTTRRNLERKKARIGFLKEIFADEINKVDPSFYERLRESKYYFEDKSVKESSVLFADPDYTDKDYYDQYETVFHLISELVSDEGKKPHDVRLVFLACLNIFKHRGHFLNDNLSGDGIADISELCADLVDRISDFDESEDNPFSDSKKLSELFERILKDKNYTGSRKKKELVAGLEISSKKKSSMEMISLVCGLKATISNIFVKEDYDEEQKKIKISFKDDNLDENMVKIEEMLLPEEYDIICVLKSIHDWAVVSMIMGSHKYISDARVALYKKHESDLKTLKALYKTYAREKYDEMFRIMAENNYSAYVGKVNSDKESQNGNHATRMQRRGAKCKKEDLYAKIKSDLVKAPESEMKKILEDMETNSFLPKQLTNENGVIPYQLHKSELVKILENASNYLPFLNEIDESGISNKQKIIDVFEFRIPYYIGPLFKNSDVSTNAWVVRKEEGRVYPWNFEDKVDVKKSAELFIERMVRQCTYLSDECALPKNSLKYERFRVLNELNSLRINGERITPDLKKQIFNDLFKAGKKKVSKSNLCDYLYINGIAEKGVEVTGMDNTFNNVLSSYSKFCELFGVKVLSDEQEEIAENIIRWSTIYGDSKKFLREKIQESYGDYLDKKQIDRVLGLKFKDWGNLSREFLNLEGADVDTGEVLPLITRMWEENYNLMELLSEKFTYKKTLEEKANKVEKSLTEIEYEDLEDLYISAPVKRMTWQTLLILKEIYQIMGYAPKKVFVEMARSEEEKKERKSSRKKRLEDLYKACKTDEDNLRRGLKEVDEAALRSKKLYLYYMQKGKCMYSGHTIDLGSLFTNDYDIDHIYPQSVVKDDSLDNNMVLVERNYNNVKSDKYPLQESWQEEMKSFWTILKKEGFINDEKYKRLTRKDELTDDELANFVNRQLVETRQATKVIAELIKKSFDNSSENTCRVVYAKAGNVSEFRHQFSTKYNKETEKSDVIHPELVKCREVNDFHHANDAYLNIVVGNVYDVKFTSNPYNYIKEYKKQKKELTPEEREKYHMDKIFNCDVKRGGEVAWKKCGDDKSLETVLKVMRKNTPIVTRMNYEAHGAIADQTIYSAEKAKTGVGYISPKISDQKLVIEKYGGYSKLTVTYFFLVEHTKKNKRIRTIEALPLYLKDQVDNKEKLEKWCADSENGLGLIDPSVRISKIKIFSKIRINGFDLCITGKSSVNLLTSNMIQLKLDPFWRYYIKKLSEYSEKKSKDISQEKNVELYDIFAEKNVNGIYAKRPNAIGQILEKGRGKFVAAKLETQVEVLINILKVFSFDNHGIDLKYLGGASRSGVMVINKNISDRESIILINQSVTGLYESQVDLLKV